MVRSITGIIGSPGKDHLNLVRQIAGDSDHRFLRHLVHTIGSVHPSLIG